MSELASKKALNRFGQWFKWPGQEGSSCLDPTSRKPDQKKKKKRVSGACNVVLVLVGELSTGIDWFIYSTHPVNSVGSCVKEGERCQREDWIRWGRQLQVMPPDKGAFHPASDERPTRHCESPLGNSPGLGKVQCQ